MTWTYEDFTKAIFKLTKIDLSCYKERQMKRRIDSLINRNNYNGYDEYYKALITNKELMENFLNYITINVSEFYRNAGQWEVLKEDILPMLIRRYGKLKIWSAACSTGEEPYSMVMLLHEFLPLDDINVIASDIDREALKRAKEGVYSEKSIQSLPKQYIKKYFTVVDGLYAIHNRIKDCVEFKHHNLLMDPYPRGCHIIICRNVMIYFTEETKSRLYIKFRESLERDGILFVGSTEQIIFPQRYGLQSIRTFFYKRI